MIDSAAELASQYERLLNNRGIVAEPCEIPAKDGKNIPDETTLQCLWLDGQFGDSFADDLGQPVLILDRGEWNRGAGPDFLNAKITINGVPLEGDIELDRTPEDWERHGHGTNPAFDRVILHLTCLPSSGTWFTRNSKHECITRVRLPVQQVDEKTRRHEPAAGSAACRTLWNSGDNDSIDRVLRMAAAFRFKRKHQDWLRRSNYSGANQALYENIAATLGYSANKMAMNILAKRLELNRAKLNPEPLLFGTAGFLIPVLPAQCSPAARAYHKELWDFWWKCRPGYELGPSRSISWTLSGIRPANNPQRRLAALAVIVAKWKEFSQLCLSGTASDLEKWLVSLSHHYWSTHATLPSAPLKNQVALVGSSRVRDFLINHLFPMRGDNKSWNAFLDIAGGEPNGKITALIHKISSSPETVKFLSAKAYRQQALLQIREDFCLLSPCLSCPLPRQASCWNLEEA